MLAPHIIRAVVRSRSLAHFQATPSVRNNSNTPNMRSAGSFEALRELLQGQERDRLVLVDFYSNWCPPCRLALSSLRKLAAEFPQVEVVSVDIEQVPRVVGDFGVDAVPKTIFLRNRERVGVITGPNQARLRRKIQDLLGSVVSETEK